MAGTLAVEGETATVMADVGRPLASLDPGQRSGRGARAAFARRPDRRGQRVLREEVKDVSEQQLLVLLLVMAAERDQIARRRRQVVERPCDRGVDMGAIGANVVKRRPAQQPARRPRNPRALGLVIAVVEEGEARVEGTVAGNEVAQDEGLEEPGRVREMPFGRRSVRHRLEAGVCVGQIARQREREGPHAIVAVAQIRRA